ncbi:MAG TPA: VanZ family protein [Candidatus Acutalibacter pullistercoris]|uniref:VanZ family protein n=1 Tax=Candidatus Acutalibacter pullistercoris TaxID=2838418 RepID=A0A9D1YBY0_9FIRM|nr:VanZ family protein [Candidatus Acutalibacter pullistercoris]
MEKKRRLARDGALYALCALYLLLLFLILFRQHHQTRSVNLVPLRSVFQYLTGAAPLGGETSELQAQFLQSLALSNLLGNLVLFFPLGVYARLFWNRLPLWASALLPAAASLCVEVLQYATAWGVADIDDLLLNAMGGALGVLVCQGVYRLLGSWDKARTLVAAAAPVAGVAFFAILIWMNR